jgi:hypothetical protein
VLTELVTLLLATSVTAQLFQLKQKLADCDAPGLRSIDARQTCPRQRRCLQLCGTDLQIDLYVILSSPGASSDTNQSQNP